MSKKTPISESPQTQSPDWGRLQIADMETALYIVATPIGNLRDITLRALDVLSSVDLVLAEDTRQTQKLLNAYGIKARLMAYHDHNVAKQLPIVLDALVQGSAVAQVCDAGTPLISDPGYKLVRAVIDAGYKVIPIPGASAPLAGLMAAGLQTDRFTFSGFLPGKSHARKKALQELISIPGSLIFFESPNRIVDSLSDMQEILGDREAVLARELTKKFEEFRRGHISEILHTLSSDPPRGEIVIMVAPSSEAQKWDIAMIDKALKEALPDIGVKQASQQIADLSGWSKRDVYQRALELK